MSEIMRPLSFAQLMEQILGEYATSEAVFGVKSEKFYRALPSEASANGQVSTGLRMFGSILDTPVGPAAGPHSQLANNIIASYLAGSRFIEVKTVQTMDGDELRAAVARPCINANDECYNVEWSTELTVQQAFEEYTKAWIAVHVLGKEFGLGTGVIFNMSVGYSLDGIKSKKIDDYIEGMKDAANSDIWQECIGWLRANRSRFANLTEADIAGIPATVSNSITVSTLHGCPADEIERIATYLLTEKHLHTYVKCNPTLLGYEQARGILDGLGYDYISFDDHHFREDLQFVDAVAMFRRLLTLAGELGLATGAKITNTFPVQICRSELPGEEMYMSGRSLFPLSITAAARLSEALDGQLAISYSGGIDAFNIEAVLACGICPLTVATTVLKPGGYLRMQQLAELAAAATANANAAAATEPMATANANAAAAANSQALIDVAALNALAQAVATGDLQFARYRKQYRNAGKRPDGRALPMFDCAIAPCSGITKDTGCPINQQIPSYLASLAAGNSKEAFATIVKDNVLPMTTGTICNHRCQTNCTRLDYDDPLRIRAAKLDAASAAQGTYIKSLSAKVPVATTKVLVIGAGPAGLAAAAYLARNGVQVCIHEKRSKAMGIVSHVIPDFRIADAAWQRDLELIEAYGVKVDYNQPADYDLDQLKKSYDYIIIATGAWAPGVSPLVPDGKNVYDALDFLEQSKNSQLSLKIGPDVVVLGGGDVAMDCARAALRNVGVEQVQLVYRRTMAQMPAQPEEIEEALADGVQVVELLAPSSYDNGILTYDRMRLGDVDESGRRSIVPTGETIQNQVSTVVVATGASVITQEFTQNNLALTSQARPKPALDANLQSSIPGVYVIGDAKIGPATIVQAMADAKLVANDILSKLGLQPDFTLYSSDAGAITAGAMAAQTSASQSYNESPVENTAPSRAQLLSRKGRLEAASEENATDAKRCLCCGDVCELCVDVCPNRANVVIMLDEQSAASCGFVQRQQILHIDRLCNECGNCAIFCPSGGKPYTDKLTLFCSEEDMADSKNTGWLPLEDGSTKYSGVMDSQTAARTASIAAVVASRYPYLIALN